MGLNEFWRRRSFVRQARLFDGDVSAADAAPAIADHTDTEDRHAIAARFMSIKGIRFSLKFKRGPLAPGMSVRLID